MNQRHIWIVAATTFTLLCLLGATTAIYRDYANARATIVSETRARARLMAAHAEQGLVSSAAALDRAAEILTRYDRTDPADKHSAQVRLSDLVTGSAAAGTMWAIGPDARPWVNNNTVETSGNDLSDRGYFKAARQDTSRIHVGPVEIGEVVKRPRFTLSRAVLKPDGSFDGVIVAGIDRSFLEAVYQRVRQTPNVVLLAFSGAGDVLATAPVVAAHTAAPARAVLPEGDATEKAVTVGDWFYAATLIPSPRVTLVAGTNMRASMRDWQRRSLQTGILALLMVAGFWLLTVQGLRAVKREELSSRKLLTANEHLEERVQERTATVELLFRELNHRVKNNLQIVASLLRLQMRKTEDPGAKSALQDSIGRIFAIADVHGEIEQVQHGEVVLKAYVGRIVGRICDAMQKPDQHIQVNLDIADATIKFDRAVLLAIAINEMVTNAFKHAFANRTTGTLDVFVTVDAEVLVLKVRNDLPASLPTDGDETITAGRSGLGSSIISMMVQQMAGTVTVRDENGYAIELRVPMT